MSFDMKKLGEISDITKLAGFEFTKHIKYKEDGEIIALRALNLRKGELDLTEIKRIDRYVSDSLTRSKLYENDILLTYTGNGYGDCAMINENDKYHLAPNICKITPDVSKVDPYYLYMYIRSNSFYQTMSSNMIGSSQPTIPMKTIRVLEVPVPNIEIQKKMGRFIKSIDEKIRSNEIINRNLWDQIDAWFYKLYTSDNAVKMKIGDVVTRCSEKVKGDEVKVLSPVSTGEILLSEDFFTKQVYSKDIGKYLKVNPFEYCYNPARANIGSIGMNDFDFTGCVSPVYVVFKTKENLRFYMSRYIRTNSFKAEVITRSSGSVRQALRYEDLVQIEFRKPSDYDLDEFNEFYLRFKMQIESIKKENARLCDLRECLLPRLMSGELDVSDLDI